jgi:mono/diheme cytochrome c family protein
MTLLTILILTLALPGQSADQAGKAVPSSPESVANGAKLYGRYCTACHGKEGRGDGAGGAKLDPKPSNLTDAEWKHGSTDADIFSVIHDGVKDTGMKSYGSRLTEHELWDVVNYIRTLKQ